MIKKIKTPNIGDVLINALPLMTATAAAVTVYNQAQGYDGIGIVQAIIYAVALEVLGAGSMTMLQKIERHNKKRTADHAQVPTWPTWLVYGLQLFTGLCIIIALGFDVSAVWIKSLFYLLSIPGTVLFSLNYRIDKIEAEYLERAKRLAESRAKKGKAKPKEGKVKQKKVNLPPLSGNFVTVYEALLVKPDETNVNIAKGAGITPQRVGQIKAKLIDRKYLDNGTH